MSVDLVAPLGSEAVGHQHGGQYSVIGPVIEVVISDAHAVIGIDKPIHLGQREVVIEVAWQAAGRGPGCYLAAQDADSCVESGDVRRTARGREARPAVR